MPAAPEEEAQGRASLVGGRLLLGNLVVSGAGWLAGCKALKPPQAANPSKQNRTSVAPAALPTAPRVLGSSCPFLFGLVVVQTVLLVCKGDAWGVWRITE